MASPDAHEAPRPGNWARVTRSPEETVRLGAELASELRGGEIILLHGELGAGKTCFAGGLATGLGIADSIISPTYVLLRSYSGTRGLTLHHLDFYRLAGDEDLNTVGVEELAGDDTVLVVEWPERCPQAFPDATHEFRFRIIGNEERRIEGQFKTNQEKK